jgi:hypothetical protein
LAALNQRQTVAIGQRCEIGKIEFAIVFQGLSAPHSALFIGFLA